MDQNMAYIIATVISGMIFMTISIRNEWREMIWSIVNKRISSSWNVFLWLLGSVIFAVIVQLACESFSVSDIITKIISGIFLGVWLAFMPNVAKN